MSETVSPTGDSQPCIVYLPGIEGTATLSSQTLLQAEELFRITQLHYPGHSRLTLEEMADGCVAALAERGGKSAIWLGESFGSALALSIAHRHPYATRGLVLAGGFTRGPRPSRLLLAARMWDSFPEKWCKAYLRRRLTRRTRREPSRIAPSSVDAFLTNGQLDFLSWRLRLLAAFDCRDNLDRIRVPLLYLGGEDDALVNTHEEARVLRESVPGARTFIFPGCGHAVLAERGVECLELLNNFVPMTKRAAA
jgi:pimeloyl-ACP methyl ester carboxylesterase